jgi:hypothetical protein
MRNLIIAVSLGAMGCAAESETVDTTLVSDSSVVAGAPAVPVTQPPAETAKAPNTRTTPTPTPPSTKTSPTTTNPARPDSVRGIVSVVGTSFDKRVMVAEQGTRRRVEIVGSQSSLIGHVAGTEVSVAGTLTGTQLDASRFVVRSVDGQPAVDGTLKTENGSLFIVTSDGKRTRIVTPPPPLVGHDGARVWITGDPAKSVSSFGFIDPPR